MSRLLLIELGLVLSVSSATSSLRAVLMVPIQEHSSLLQAQATLRVRPSLLSAPENDGCTFDHSGLDEVLQKFVKHSRLLEGIESSVFDYKGILASDDFRKKLDDYVDALSSFEVSCLSANGKLAFWTNTYNALIISLVLGDATKNGGQLTESIRDLKGSEKSVWDRKAGIVAGKALTLEEVLGEARKLGDPRIHAAVNCASLSCPDLRSSAYSEDNIQTELDTQVKKWLRNPTKGAKKDGDGLLLSPIFQWHAEDFPSVGDFVAVPLGVPSSVKVTGYLDYNWHLNAAPRTASTITMTQSSAKSASALSVTLALASFA